MDLNELTGSHNLYVQRVWGSARFELVLIINDDDTNELYPKNEIIGVLKEHDDNPINNTLEYFDSTTGDIVLEIGYNNIGGSMSPFKVLLWSPENLFLYQGYFECLDLSHILF